MMFPILASVKNCNVVVLTQVRIVNHPLVNQSNRLKRTKWPHHIQYIPRNMHTVFALLCFVVVIH